ncbi:hypothetical protein LCGC14_1281870 [marine sediment metagenome]|uniref:YopX protein domain-containing protein n=1 Tax=marine sediment metagenome TaxID=412755 RepID=A0A0F9KUZ0_9ZZZZ
MRPYRGIPINCKKFVYGSAVKLGKRIIIVPIPPEEKSPANDITLLAQIAEYHEVIPETAGQASGRKDENNKEIYEGDCFKTSDEHGYSSNCIAEVLFDEESCGFVVQIHRHDELEVWPELLPDYKRNFPDSFEVIGTVHTHPELLRK